jgi:hypothetical protein
VITSNWKKLSARKSGRPEANSGVDIDGDAFEACGKLQQITANIR